MYLSLQNKHVHLASAFISGFSLGYLICLYKRKCKPTGGQPALALPALLSTKKCTDDLCPIDMNIVFKKADEQLVKKPDINI